MGCSVALKNKIITRGNKILTKGNKIITGCACTKSCSDADLPSSVLLTFPDASSWGWNAGSSCSPSVTSVVLTKTSGQCRYDASNVCIGGKLTIFTVSLTYGGASAGWTIYISTNSANQVDFVSAGKTICDLIGTYSVSPVGGVATPPATVTVS